MNPITCLVPAEFVFEMSSQDSRKTGTTRFTRKSDGDLPSQHASRQERMQSGKQMGAGFNFTDRMRLLCEDVVTRTEELQHVRMAEVAVSFSRCRKDVDHG